MKLPEFDIAAYLDAQDLSWTDDPKHVTRKAVALQCPYCDDTGYHLGVFRDGKNFSCFKCGAKGNLFRLMRKLRNMDWDTFVTSVQSVVSSQYPNLSPEEIVARILQEDHLPPKPRPMLEVVPWPDGCYPIPNLTPEWRGLTDWFLQRRRYTVGYAIARGCRVAVWGRYSHRLVIPFTHEGQMVGWQARDMTGRAGQKYMTPDGFQLHHYLYGLDRVQQTDSLTLVEGVFDSWRIGGDAVATGGTNLSDRQRNLILGRQLKTLVFAWDSDAYLRALKQARQFVGLVPIIRVVLLPQGHDPDSIGEDAFHDIQAVTGELCS